MDKHSVIQIKDNFLDDEYYQEIIDLSDTVHYHEAEEYWKKYGASGGELVDYNWKAWDGCQRSDNYVNYLEDFVDAVNSIFDMRISRLEFFRHPIDRFPTYAENIEQHVDGRFEISGVLYLPHGKEGYGTTIGQEYVEWKRNRVVVFPAKTLHNPHFGGIDRKILTFFGYNA